MDRNRKHIAYILLYYNAYNDTVECINSLIKLNNTDCDVSYVIVNNASPDGSFPELKSRLQKIPNVYFIETKDNIGFARGNNTGIRFAKNKLNADFVIALNTDTVIEQIDFNNEIIRLFKEEQYYVLGPKVMSYNSDRLQSPIGNALENKPVKRYIENKLRLLLWETGLIFLLRRIRKPDTSISDGTRVFDKYHCVCSGCCLIFSPLFLAKWDGFYSNTFLYREETILFYILNTLQCKTLYSDELSIYHKGGSANNTAYGKNERKRAIRYHKMRNDSLIQEMKIKHLKADSLSDLLVFSD